MFTPSTVRHISADNVLLCLVARKAKPFIRWAALSTGASTSSCRPRSGPGYCIPRPSLLYPMLSSVDLRLVDRVRIGYGLAEVKRTWGIGYKALKAELTHKGAHA